MREILFRAKAINRDPDKEYRTDYQTGAWVYGLVAKMWNEKFPYLPAEITNERGITGIEVDHRTIGQYTGLTDTNGKKIFEGDIVLTQEYYNRPYSENRKTKRHIGVVEYKIYSGKRFYNEDTGKMDRKCDYGAEWMVSVKDYGVYVHGAWGDFFDCEVIGNIYDNPELMKGENNVKN